MPVVWAALAVIGLILALWVMGLMGRGVVPILRHIDWRGRELVEALL